MRHVARRRLGLALATTLTLAAAAAVLPGTTAAAAASGSYYRAEPVCAAPAAGHARCFALRRVTVSRHVLGARKAETLPADLPVGPVGGFTPGDLAKAYGVNPAAATTQTVGIVDAFDDPSAHDDLNVFDDNYGLPAETATSFRKVGQSGSASLPVPDTTGWSGEISLDLDAVRGMCHKCKIILVEANSSDSADLAAAVNTAVKLGATEVSNSYGGPEDDPDDPETPAETKAYNHPGVVITASTGDDGYYDWDYTNDNYAVPTPDPAITSGDTPELPSSLNTVVAVGGTTLQLNDDGTRAGESVWNENGTFDNTGFYAAAPQGATGGGCSTLYPAQKWQSSVAHYSQTACGTKRLAADVSALADPDTGFDIYDSNQIPKVNECGGNAQPSCWGTFGGTSLASPLIAAMWALAGGSGGVTYPALSLYGHQKSVSSSLYDVTVGGNGFCAGVSPGECGSPFDGGNPNTGLGVGVVDCAWDADGNPAAGTRACDAATGYDGPSGVGTPKGLTAFKALSPHGVITAPKSLTHRRAAAFSGRSSTDPFPGGVVTHYRWTWGDGSASSTSAAPSHTYGKKGTFIVRLVVSDTYGRVSATVSKRVTVK